MANNIKILYNNINSFNNKSQLVYNYIENNNVDCALFTESKTKTHTQYRDWTIIEKLGNIINKNTRGGSIAMIESHLKIGKANPPHQNDVKNECIHFTIPFKNDKLHIFLIYIHPYSALEDTIFTKASLCKYAIIYWGLQPKCPKKETSDQISRQLTTCANSYATHVSYDK